MPDIGRININLEGQPLNNQLYLIYVFTPCCPNKAIIRLKPSSTHLPSGVVYNFDEGNDYTGPEIGLVSEACYTLTHQFIDNEELYNSLATTPYQQGPAILWSPPGDFPDGCESVKCQNCTNYPNLGTFTIQSCCDENYQETFHIYQYPLEPFPVDIGYVFEYTGNVIPQGCYQIVRDGGVYVTAVFPFLEVDDFIEQTGCENTVCQSYCPQEVCYTLVNCFEDVSINVQFTPGTVVNNGEVISINLEPGSTITREVNEYYLCGNMNLHTGGGGFVSVEFNQLAPSTQLYNGRPFYTLEYVYNDEERTNYIVWSGTHWKVWKDFDIITGPSCLDCLCNEPYLQLIYASGTAADLPAPLVNVLDDVSGTYSAFNPIGCHGGSINPGIPSGFRSLDYCPGVITTVLPDNNCWTIQPFPLPCDLQIIKNVELYTEITEDNIDTFWDAFQSLFVANGLTQSDILGNYFSSNLVTNIPGSPQGLTVTGGTVPYTYFWEILNQSGTYSNVSIVDSSVFPVELIQTGPSAGDPFIRLKLTVTDSEECETELIFFTGGFN